MNERNGVWIETFTGRKFWPLAPRPEDVCIEDIAHALANQCRFSGHVREFYSVAQHSVLVSSICPPADKFWGLLHDAPEAYLVDLPSPIKHDDRFGAQYREAERRIMASVCERFGLAMEEPESVRLADRVMCINEARQMMPSRATTWGWGCDVAQLEEGISCMTPPAAEHLFLSDYERLR